MHQKVEDDLVCSVPPEPDKIVCYLQTNFKKKHFFLSSLLTLMIRVQLSFTKTASGVSRCTEWISKLSLLSPLVITQGKAISFPVDKAHYTLLPANEKPVPWHFFVPSSSPSLTSTA